MTIKKITTTLFLFLIMGLVTVNAQEQKGDLVDGIAAIVGEEIILESEVMDQFEIAKQQGAALDKCTVLESVLTNKFLVHAAKQDTLIDPRTEAIRQSAEMRYNQILSQFPSEKEMLKFYKFRTSYEMKNTIEKVDSEQYLMQSKFARITDGVDVTPQEVSQFFEEFQYKLPPLKDKVKLSSISIYPKLTDAHKKELIDKLKKIKADIEGGEDFASQARIYSEDLGSASNGGLIKNISKGQMVKPFEAAALSLQVGEISDPIESEFGYHIIRLEKKMGKLYEASHILLMAVPTEEEIAEAKKELEKIKIQIKDEKITFKEAAYKFSDDKSTKFNAGLLQNREDGSSGIDKATLNADVAYQIAGLHNGDLTEVFVDELNNRKAVKLMRLEEEIPAHQMTLETDYDDIKQFAIQAKKNEILENWIKREIPNAFISIDKRYDDCTFSNQWKK